MQTRSYQDMPSNFFHGVSFLPAETLACGRKSHGTHAHYAGWIIVRYLPEWLPGANFKREARDIKVIANESRWLPYNMVKRQVCKLIWIYTGP